MTVVWFYYEEIDKYLPYVCKLVSQTVRQKDRPVAKTKKQEDQAPEQKQSQC